jgi:hypothetical protein
MPVQAQYNQRTARKIPYGGNREILDPNREVHASKLPENAELFSEYLALRALISTRK